MSNAKNNEIKATAVPPRHPAPDGKSQLPDTLPDFPGSKDNDSGPTSGPMPK